MQRLAERWKRAGIRVCFVPTMGSLHEGHISLIERARRLAGPKGRVVASVYVNPTQFGPNEDFRKYPRDLARDAALCREAKVDLLFVPTDQQMYLSSRGDASSTCVVETALSQRMEGASRPTHFRGVTTVVAKLFNIVLPDVAVFGAKDFQQAAVIQRMVRDLNFPVRIVVAPTKREADGLAMSSRNRYLSVEERKQAVVLWQAIQLARESVQNSRSAIPAARLKARLVRFVSQQSAARVDYAEFVDPVNLDPVSLVRSGTHLALAVFIGRTRLIDNGRL
jgi:pantoate--beta-alanine ligase